MKSNSGLSDSWLIKENLGRANILVDLKGEDANLLQVALCRCQVRAHLAAYQTPVADGLQWDWNTVTLAS